MLFCIAVFIALLYPSLLWKSLTRDWAEKQQDYWARSKRINPVKFAPIVWLAATGASGLSLIILLSNRYEFYSPHWQDVAFPYPQAGSSSLPGIAKTLLRRVL